MCVGRGAHRLFNVSTLYTTLSLSLSRFPALSPSRALSLARARSLSNSMDILLSHPPPFSLALVPSLPPSSLGPESSLAQFARRDHQRYVH